jgi:hypothetical protein
VQVGQEYKEGTMRQVVPICCFCEKVRDDTGTEPGGGLWQDFKLYMAIYRLRPEDVMFSHTYCPACLSYYRSFLSLPAGATHRNQTEGEA